MARMSVCDQSNYDGCDDEGELHAQIIQECKRRGWLPFHGSMAHKSRRTPGEADFTILVPGSVIFIECKTRTGKQSPDQLAVSAMAARLGHTIHIVRSFPEFISLISLLHAKQLGIVQE